MGLKEKSYKMFMFIPHLALLWDMRRHQRCEPLEGLDIEIKTKDEKIYALLLDICIGGMRIISTDKRIEDSKTISLSVDDFRVELPCEKIRRIEYYYGIKFGSMDKQELTNLEYFIEHFTKDPPSSGLPEILK
jgi:hypothetical protein